jgi:ankyrin repeat protein
MSTHGEFIASIADGRLDTVRDMLSADPGLVNARHENGVSAVLFSLYVGKNEITRLLIDRGARLDLFEASATGAQDAVERLLQKEPASINTFSVDGWTPLHLAVFFGRVNIVHLLLGKGANIDALSRNDLLVAPIHSALANPDNSAVGQLLIGAGANLNVRQSEGYTPLHYAAANGLDHVVRSLLAHAVDTGIRNHQGKTAYELALDRGQSSTAELLKGSEPTHP